MGDRLIAIYVLQGQGYVWDAEDARCLRLDHGVVGAMVGGVAAFKQQNAVHGLPLELSEEEVTLALEKGIAEIRPPLPGLAGLVASPGAGGGGGGGGARKRGRPAYDEDDEDDNDYGADWAEEEEEPAEAAAPPAWEDAIASGSAFDIPTTMTEEDLAAAAAAAAAAAGGSGPGNGASTSPAAAPAAAGEAAAAAAAAAGAAAAPPAWAFPSTAEERQRYRVYRDLHARGFRVTGGSKFGADFLVYPGDPTIYHAQFCVRLLGYRVPLLPAMLASAARGSHQARKHLLLASVVEGEGDGALGAGDGGSGDAGGRVAAAAEGGVGRPGEGPLAGVSGGEGYRIYYTTLGPVDGFG